MGAKGGFKAMNLDAPGGLLREVKEPLRSATRATC
jgi:hypothetical protein